MNKVEEIKQYRTNPALNYSLLKDVLSNNTKPFKGNKHSEWGSQLDDRLSLSDSDFWDLYVLGEEEKETGKLAEIVNKFFERYSYYQPIDKPLTHYLDKLIQSAIDAKYGGKTKKLDTLTNELLTLSNHWEMLIIKQTKSYISPSELTYIDKVVHMIKTTAPGKFIMELNPEFQKVLLGTVEVDGKQVAVKGLADMIVELPDKILLVDLKKTSFNLDSWHENCYKSRYFMQMALYHDILAQMYPNKLIECMWLCVNAYDVRIYPTHEADLRFGRTGNKVVYSSCYDHTDEVLTKEVTNLGYIDAIKIYLQSKELGLEDYNIEKFQNNGVYPKKSVFE